MSKKLKGVALVSSPFGVYEDAKSRIKHQTLMQDYQELCKETDTMRNKLETMKHRKVTLLAEVRFLRRRYKHLLKNKSSNPQQELEIVQQGSLGSHHKKNTKEKIYSRKKAALHRLPLMFDPYREERVNIGKQIALGNASPMFVSNHKETLHCEKGASLRIPSPVSDLNHRGKIYGGKEAAFRKPMPVVDLNKIGRVYSGNDAAQGNPALVYDLNQKKRSDIGKEAAVHNRAPIFDLNEISREEEEFENNCEASSFEEPKKGLIRGGSDEQHNDLKLSICRNIGNGSARVGKRKISWQDPVALRV